MPFSNWKALFQNKPINNRRLALDFFKNITFAQPLMLMLLEVLKLMLGCTFALALL